MKTSGRNVTVVLSCRQPAFPLLVAGEVLDPCDLARGCTPSGPSRNHRIELKEGTKTDATKLTMILRNECEM